MIIITKSFNKARVIELCDEPEKLLEYVKTIVPEIYHHTPIVSNQCYYISSQILKDNSIDIDLRRRISNSLMRYVKVAGYLGNFIVIGDVEHYVNFNKLNKYYEGDKKNV